MKFFAPALVALALVPSSMGEGSTTGIRQLGGKSKGKGKGKSSKGSKKSKKHAPEPEPVCEFNRFFSEPFDTDKKVPSSHTPYADLSVWEGNRLCPGADNDSCDFKPEPEPAHRFLTKEMPPNYAIGKAYGACTTLGIELNTFCTDQWFFEDGSSLLSQGAFLAGGFSVTQVVVGGTGCFKNAQGTVEGKLVVDPHTLEELYVVWDITHVVVTAVNITLLD